MSEQLEFVYAAVCQDAERWQTLRPYNLVSAPEEATRRARVAHAMTHAAVERDVRESAAAAWDEWRAAHGHQRRWRELTISQCDFMEEQMICVIRAMSAWHTEQAARRWAPSHRGSLAETLSAPRGA